MRRHILPNILLPLLVLIATRIGSTVLTVAAMSYLGLGPAGTRSGLGDHD